MDFGDFLLESQHEGPITSVRISKDGRKQAIGTSSGTLGLLDVSAHRQHHITNDEITSRIALNSY